MGLILSLALVSVPVIGYWYANNPEFHKGSSGFGSCTTADNVVDSIDKKALKGKVILITGANSGIGKDTAKSLAKAGAHLLLPCRTLAKARELAKELDGLGGTVTPLELDLSDLDSCRKCVAQIKALNLPLSIIICNAGVMAIPTRTETKQGLEMQMGVCHVAHFLLVTELLPILEKSGPSKVVALSSMGHRLCKDPEVFRSSKLEGADYDAWTNYGNAKMANILFARELNERYSNSGIQAFSLHPGGIHTNLQVHVSWKTWLYWLLVTPYFFKSTAQGAATTVYCATHPDAEAHSGEYFQDCNAAKMDEKRQSWVNDAQLRKAFWVNSEKLIKE